MKWDDCPEHEWIGVEDIGNSEYRTCVRCIICGVPGELDHADGSVFWPAT